MKKLFLFTFLLVSGMVVSQPRENGTNSKTKRLIKEVTKLVKKHSLYSDALNWQQIGREINTLPLVENDSINRSIVIDFFTKTLRQAGDSHSFFLTAQRITAFKRNPITPLQPEGAYLGNDIGLIKVPYCMTFDLSKDRAFANAIRREIKKIDTSHPIKGWIVDLRQNVGGNMWPMLAGLNALIDDGTVGYFVSTASRKERPWISKNGQINFPMRKIDDYKARNRNTKIAVLIDSMTASSGEMTAISFLGLSHVKVFGQPSAGLTTANTTFNLSDGTQLYLATTYAADRTKKPYREKIIPDIITSSTKNAERDETLEASKAWLLNTD